VADRLATLAGEGNPVIRMGGDEFVLAQTTALSPGEVEIFARAIFEAVSAPYCIQGHDIVIGASIGVAIAGRDGETIDALLSRADMALYQAKVYRGGYVLAADLPPSSQPDDDAANGRLVAA
jgi:diguanylate cyclase (GGDEF)-like protein